MKTSLTYLLLLPLAAMSAAVNVKPSPFASHILTPKPGPAPRINSPKIFGMRPGSPFLYSIPATGAGP